MKVKQVATNIKIWLEEQLYAADADGFVVGMSGGIDSAVVATLCRKVTDNVLGVFIPIGYTPEGAWDDAAEVADKFDVELKMQLLVNIYDEMVKAMGGNPASVDLATVNIKPRLRMTVLYYFANKYNYLVAGTGNRTEMEIGYSTKYGDGGVDILPIGDLLKVEVRALASYLGIPNHIIDKPPTAGLWEGQTDEGELEMTYKQIDMIFTRIDRSKHKRHAPPICPIE